jgi:hypothetical protein
LHPRVTADVERAQEDFDVKKLSALATVSAMTFCLVSAVGAGCSSTTTNTTTTADSGPDATRPRPDAAPEDAGPAVCPTTDPIASTDLAYAEPTPLKMDCTVDDYNALVDYLNKNQSATVSNVDTFLKTRGTACHDCVFADASGGTWGPLPIVGGQLQTINVGSCFTIVTGNPVLGKDIQNLFDCESVACGDCTDQSSYTACKSQADKGACKGILAQAQQDFASVDQTLFDTCGSFTDSVREQCVGAIDAGDAGDAGDASDDADAADAADADDADADQ